MDSPAFELLPPAAPSPLLFLCDHASRALPPAYGTLGLDAAPGTPADFAQIWKTDYERLGGIIRDLGLDTSAR